MDPSPNTHLNVFLWLIYGLKKTPLHNFDNTGDYTEDSWESKELQSEVEIKVVGIILTWIHMLLFSHCP